MAKISHVLGLMSGTSMDGIDAALLRTDGQAYVEPLFHTYTPYPEDVRVLLRAVLGRAHDVDGSVAKASRMITDWHIRAVKDFLAKSPHKPDLIGFHGQTIFHDPANGHTWQIGDGKRLAKETRIDVVYDFRTADVKAGGQGAPLLPLYHQALVKAQKVKGQKIEEPACVLNLGGVANITWIKGDDVIACDTGPANALIDDWMLKKTGTAIDKNGETALRGHTDVQRVQQWLTHPFFSLSVPKSLDRNAFQACRVDDLSLEDGAATLAAFTVQSVLAGLKLMPEPPKILIIAGGGRHNAAIMTGLQNAVRVMNADALGWNGDGLEAEGFAYLAQRSRLNLPLSLPTTTGCQFPTKGGIFCPADAL
jgi:anhydro-N-acetylmuramic acid kinase